MVVWICFITISFNPLPAYRQAGNPPLEKEGEGGFDLSQGNIFKGCDN
jgi:hypothetical protein